MSEAAAGGCVETVKYFINNGAPVNKLAHFHRTPLFRAAFGGHLAAVEVLLQHGGDPRITDNDALTPQVCQTSAKILISAF